VVSRRPHSGQGFRNDPEHKGKRCAKGIFDRRSLRKPGFRAVRPGLDEASATASPIPNEHQEYRQKNSKLEE
jgi:hypothetical protein